MYPGLKLLLVSLRQNMKCRYKRLNLIFSLKNFPVRQVKTVSPKPG